MSANSTGTDALSLAVGFGEYQCIPCIHMTEYHFGLSNAFSLVLKRLANVLYFNRAMTQQVV